MTKYINKKKQYNIINKKNLIPSSMLAKKKEKKINDKNNQMDYIYTNIDNIIENIKDEEEYQEFLTANEITHEIFLQKLNEYFITRNSRINLTRLNPEQKDIIKNIFGQSKECKKYIFLFSIQHGIGGDESEFFVSDYLEMHGKNIEYFLQSGRLYENKNKHIKLENITSGTDYYLEYNCKDIDFETLKIIIMLLQEGPNIRVQRQPTNSTQMQTSTILLNTHMFNINKTEAEIKAQLLQDKYLIWETFRASGAGGQHVNKTSSAVRLRHAILSNVNIVSQQERNQIQNRRTALKKLEDDITQEIISLIKIVLSNKESNAGRNIKSTTYNYRRKNITHEDGSQHTFESIKKNIYKEQAMQRIINNQQR